MPNITPLQNDFSVGEVAPDVAARSTLEARNKGVETLKNFYTDPRGPVIRRNGFRFLGEIGAPIDIGSVCDRTLSKAAEVDFTFGWQEFGNIAAEKDGSGAVVVMNDNSQEGGDIRVFNDGGGTSWSQTQTLSTTQDIKDQDNGAGMSWGESIAYSPDNDVLFIGVAGLDNVIAGFPGLTTLNCGGVVKYVGNTSSGFAYSSLIRSPDGINTNEKFGSAVGLSNDGSVLVVSSRFNDSNCKLHYYGHTTGDNYTHLGTQDITGSGGGKIGQYNIELDETGAWMAVSEIAFGAGAIGRVNIFERQTATNYTLFQSVDRPDLTTLSLPGLWQPDDSTSEFGTGADLSDDALSLFVFAGWSISPAGVTPHVFVYERATTADQFTFSCLKYDTTWVPDTLFNDSYTQSVATVFNDTSQRLFSFGTRNPLDGGEDQDDLSLRVYDLI